MNSEYANIPEMTLDALTRYVEKRIPTGGFLRAVLTNDLMGAMAKADIANQEALPSICKYVYNRVPSGCWGNEEIVDSWLKRN